MLTHSSLKTANVTHVARLALALTRVVKLLLTPALGEDAFDALEQANIFRIQDAVATAIFLHAAQAHA